MTLGEQRETARVVLSPLVQLYMFVTLFEVENISTHMKYRRNTC